MIRLNIRSELVTSHTVLFHLVVLSYLSIASYALQSNGTDLLLPAGAPPPFAVHPRVITPTAYRWSHGWTMVVEPGPAILPVEDGAAMLTAFYNRAMAIAAAHMLSPSRGLSGTDFSDGVFFLRYLVIDRGPANVVLEWNLVYWFAAYMQAIARRGNTSIGRVLWRHESGIVIGISLRLLVDVRVQGGSGSWGS